MPKFFSGRGCRSGAAPLQYRSGSDKMAAKIHLHNTQTVIHFEKSASAARPWERACQRHDLGSGGRLAEGHMIRFIDVYKEYDNGTKALKGVSMRIDDGEFVFLVGPSGSGKSTIIKLITGEIATTEGRLMVNGYNMNNIRPGQVPYMRRTLGIIFQDFRLIEKKDGV